MVVRRRRDVRAGGMPGPRRSSRALGRASHAGGFAERALRARPCLGMWRVMQLLTKKKFLEGLVNGQYRSLECRGDLDNALSGSYSAPTRRLGMRPARDTCGVARAFCINDVVVEVFWRRCAWRNMGAWRGQRLRKKIRIQIQPWELPQKKSTSVHCTQPHSPSHAVLSASASTGTSSPPLPGPPSATSFPQRPPQLRWRFAHRSMSAGVHHTFACSDVIC